MSVVRILYANFSLNLISIMIPYSYVLRIEEIGLLISHASTVARTLMVSSASEAVFTVLT